MLHDVIQKKDSGPKRPGCVSVVAQIDTVCIHPNNGRKEPTDINQGVIKQCVLLLAVRDGERGSD